MTLTPATEHLRRTAAVKLASRHAHDLHPYTTRAFLSMSRVPGRLHARLGVCPVVRRPGHAGAILDHSHT